MVNGGTIDKGLIQLAQRSGRYQYLNADVVYEGETVRTDRLSGMVEISGEPASDKAIGYFAYMKMVNGYEKCLYWTRERVQQHAKKYSKAYGRAGAPWQEHFDEMAIKTVVKQLIGKWGILSVDMASAFEADATPQERAEAEIEANANAEPAVIAEFEPEDKPDMPKAEEPPKQLDITAQTDYSDCPF